jgi:DNA processing protein
MGEGLEAGSAAAEPVGDLRSELDGLDPVVRAVFEGLPARRYARAEELAARSGVSPLDVIRVLPALDDAGLLERDGTGFRVAARVRASAGRR